MKPTMKKAASLLLALFIAVCSDLVSSQGGEGEDQTGSVDVSGTSVTLTCPLTGTVSDPGSTTWQYKEEEKKIPDTDGKTQITLQTYNSTNNGLYKCSNGNDHYHFYVKVKVCESCVEVEVVPMIGIIFADLLVTAGVAILVYYWAQNRKGASAMAPAARPGRQNRAPPVPNPDYEPIRTGNREVYSGLNKRT
ncbi:T-cell surface glycoprotein CD3 epsilon chain isoform X1 [Acipenser ruthenus]|uniref:T-cell surface glycoprotein CD3 epsilon chain isoform X1 n=1 Tax=Acipenser ruthenus TaxID=7906 RepID=UPI0027409F78|nr:T-cell surface glycoprotein CD3 epsilon chain isoform X1 [Acipenser ruthenus]